MNDAKTWEMCERLRAFRNSTEELTSEDMSVVQNRSIGIWDTVFLSARALTNDMRMQMIATLARIQTDREM
jgi:hypothetical protein